MEQVVDVDKELERRGLRFVRYADDLQIFVRSERSAQRMFESVQRYLTQRLKLVVNRYLRGWIGYFGLARQFDEFVELDGWIRRRVRMSRTPAMRYAMPNKWLEQQGLLSLKHLWGQLAPLRGTA